RQGRDTLGASVATEARPDPGKKISGSGRDSSRAGERNRGNVPPAVVDRNEQRRPPNRPRWRERYRGPKNLRWDQANGRGFPSVSEGKPSAMPFGTPARFRCPTRACTEEN